MIAQTLSQHPELLAAAGSLIPLTLGQGFGAWIRLWISEYRMVRRGGRWVRVRVWRLVWRRR